MRQWTVDAFAARPFRGNPACVVEPFDAWPADGWMQALAAENNQAETAFLRRTDDAARFELRWFTPTTEVALCGHATLASAHVLFAEIGVASDRLAFDTRRSGRLTVERRGEALRMDFPASPATEIPAPQGLAEALGAPPKAVFASRFLIAELDDEAAVRSLTPDIAAIGRFGVEDEPGAVVVTACADPGRPYRVVSRFFAPGSGIAEDPTTGGAHCALAPLWAPRLGGGEIAFHQAYPGRGGDLTAEVVGERVLISGSAVTVMETRLRLEPES